MELSRSQQISFIQTSENSIVEILEFEFVEMSFAWTTLHVGNLACRKLIFA